MVKIAVDFQRRWMQNILDLVQEGNVGLMHALYKFDPDKGIKFSYYASFWIKAYILKFIMDNFRMVKIGTTQVQRRLFFNLSRERQKLIAEGFDPDAEMLSKRLGVSKSDIQEMDQRMSSGDVSLNVPVGDDSDSATRMDFLPALGPGVEDSIASSEISDILREKLKAILPQLNEKEIYILNHRLLTENPETLRKIGEHFNVTRERILPEGKSPPLSATDQAKLSVFAGVPVPAAGAPNPCAVPAQPENRTACSRQEEIRRRELCFFMVLSMCQRNL